MARQGSQAGGGTVLTRPGEERPYSLTGQDLCPIQRKYFRRHSSLQSGQTAGGHHHREVIVKINLFIELKSFNGIEIIVWRSLEWGHKR